MSEQQDERLARALAALPPAPRKSDAAFARGVADGVRARRSARSPFVFALPTAAAAAAAFAFVAVVHTPDRAVLDAGVAAGASAARAPDQEARAPRVVALADLDDDDDFALPSLEGSSAEELERLDKALDAALQQHPGAPR